MAESPLRFALVGAGMVSGAHAESLKQLPEARLTKVYSRTAERARAFAEKFGVPWTVNFADILRDPEIDTVVITSAPYNHAEQAIAAMEAGKHALVEKPLAISVAECDRMAAVAARTKRTLGAVFQSRFKKGVRRAQEFVTAGGLGRLLHVSGYVKWHRPQSYYEANDWRGRRDREGGGVVFSQAGHTLDLMRWIGGPVDWVFANAVTAPVHRGIEIENLASVTLRFTGGATGVLEASTALYPGSPERLELHGERGTIALESGNLTTWKIHDPKPGDEPGDTREETGTGAANPMAFPITWHRALIADFVDAVRRGRPPQVDAREARRLNVLCEAIYQSARDLAVARVKED